MSGPRFSEEEWKQIRYSWSTSYLAVENALRMARRKYKPKTRGYMGIESAIEMTENHRKLMMAIIDALQGMDRTLRSNV